MNYSGPLLPSSWVVAPIEHLLEPLPDGRLLHHGWSPQCEASSSNEGEWGVLKTTAIQDGVFLPEHNKRLPQKLAPRPDLAVQEGDLLLTCAGPRARCGVPCLVRGTRPRLILSGKMYRFRTRQGAVDSRFAEAYLRSPVAQELIDRMKTGISDSGLNLTHGRFLRLPVPIAPALEQLRIVAKIEELFSDLDAGVAALERVRANLKRYRAAVLKAAVEGRLTEEWRKRNPSTEPAAKLLDRILAERRTRWEADQLRKSQEAGRLPPKGWRALYAGALQPTALHERPQNWCFVSVEQLAAVGTGTTPPRSNQRYYGGGSIPWVTSAAANEPFVRAGSEFVTDEAIQETSLRLYPVHTLVLALYGEGRTRGRVSELLIPATVNQALAALTLDGTASACRPFLKLFLDSNYVALRSQSAGGVQPNLNLGIVRSIAFGLPPLAEQLEILAEVDRRLSVADAAGRLVEQGLRRAVRLRQAILKSAFEGRLVPQDSTDEPADALLRRLRGMPDSVSAHGHDAPTPRRTMQPTRRDEVR